MTKNAYQSLIRRLAQAGFKKQFIRSAILPDWWDETCEDDPDLLHDLEIRVARFLGQPLTVIRNATVALSSPVCSGAQLRQVRDLDRDRLGPAIHAAMRVAAATVRNLRQSAAIADIPPIDGLAWRNSIRREAPPLLLLHIATDLWNRGIPIIPLEFLPSPSFQGMACCVEDRPVILVAHKHDEPGRVAFLVGHEAGHIAHGDCIPEHPVIDGDESSPDGSDMELRADRFATLVVIGSDAFPEVVASDYKSIAHRAAQIETESGAEASAVIFAWARRTGDHATAARALKALHREHGARALLRHAFEERVDLDAASDSDRALLNCVTGYSEQDETGR